MEEKIDRFLDFLYARHERGEIQNTNLMAQVANFDSYEDLEIDHWSGNERMELAMLKEEFERMSED